LCNVIEEKKAAEQAAAEAKIAARMLFVSCHDCFCKIVAKKKFNFLVVNKARETVY
jgi:hypothetical protein